MMTIPESWVSIKYLQGKQFEIDHAYVLPTNIVVDLTAGIYTLYVPDYCVDSNNKIQNAIMWSLYPQYSTYDFASGQV